MDFYNNYYNNDFYSFDINLLYRIKNIKYEIYDSSYISYLIKFDTNDDDILKLLFFYVREIDITEDIINTYNIQKYHIELIRRLYFKNDDYIKIDPKKPYGNSSIIDDIKKVVYDIENINIDDNTTLKIHKQTINFFIILIKKYGLFSNEFEKINNEWFPTKNGMKYISRLKKLKDLKNARNISIK